MLLEYWLNSEIIEILVYVDVYEDLSMIVQSRFPVRFAVYLYSSLFLIGDNHVPSGKIDYATPRESRHGTAQPASVEQVGSSFSSYTNQIAECSPRQRRTRH